MLFSSIPIYAETPQQANPVATGAMMANNAIQGGIQNMYLPSTLAANLVHQQLMNQMLQSQADISPEMAQAQLSNAQMQAPYTGAQIQEIMNGRIPQEQAMGGYYGAQGNLLNQTTPYRVQQAQNSVYTDPILSRLRQIAMANQTGAIPRPVLASVGMASPGMPDLNSYTPSGAGPQNIAPSQILPPNAYGNNPNTVTTPKAFGGNGFQNWALFGSPYNPIEMNSLIKGSGAQATTGVTQWNDALNAANTDASLGYNLQNFAKQFQNGYEKSTYTGPIKGKIPSSGWETAFVPGNLSNEQITDNASQNAAALVAKLIAGGRVTNYEMQYMQTLKPNRLMTPQAAAMTSDFLIQRAKQMQQLPQFLKAAQSEGVDVYTAQNLWNMYRNQRPVYDFQNQKANTQFDGSWRDFLTPSAIDAAVTGKPYVSIPSSINNDGSFMNWYRSLSSMSDRNLAKQEYLSEKNNG